MQTWAVVGCGGAGKKGEWNPGAAKERDFVQDLLSTLHPLQTPLMGNCVHEQQSEHWVALFANAIFVSQSLGSTVYMKSVS